MMKKEYQTPLAEIIDYSMEAIAGGIEGEFSLVDPEEGWE